METVNLLGVTITNKLTWARLLPEGSVPFYKTCIRFVIDCSIPVFYYSLPQYLKSGLVCFEKRALSIIIPGENYQSATKKLGINPLNSSRAFVGKTLSSYYLRFDT